MEREQILDHIMTKLLERGADDVVLSQEGNRKTQIKFANNEIVTTKTWDSLSLSIFMNFKQRIVATTLHDFSRSTADGVIKKLIAFAKAAHPNQNYLGVAKGPFRYAVPEKCHDNRIASMSEQSIDLVKSGVDAALAVGAKRSAGVFEFNEHKEYLLTSGGIDSDDKGTFYYFSVRSHAAKEASGYSNMVGRELPSFDPAKAGKDAGRIAKQALKPQRVDEGRYDILMTPYPFANLLDNFGDATSIFAIEAGWSFLANLLGKKILSPKLTLYDDATIAEGLNSSKFDNEGFPSKKTLLVDKGVLKTYLHNTSTAKRYNTESTGNAGLIAPTSSNLVIEKGTKSTESLLGDFTGLCITNTWYTRFQNYLTSDFSTIPRDGIFLYKDGRFIKSVKDIRISDNLLNMLKNVTAVSKDRIQQCGWEVENPVFTGSALFKDVNITKSTS